MAFSDTAANRPRGSRAISVRCQILDFELKASCVLLAVVDLVLDCTKELVHDPTMLHSLFMCNACGGGSRCVSGCLLERLSVDTGKGQT